MRFALLGFAGVALCGCRNASVVAVAPQPPVARVVSSVTEIFLHRDPGMSIKPQPHYSVILRSDGTANYIGDLGAQIGTFRASVNTGDFAKVAKAVDDLKFERLPDYFGPAMDDIREAYTSVVSGGHRKTVLVWGDGKGYQPSDEEASKALLDLESQIDAVAAHLRWVKVSNETKSPDYKPGLTIIGPPKAIKPTAQFGQWR